MWSHKAVMEWFALGLVAFALTILTILGLVWTGDRMFAHHKPACLSAHDERIRERLVVRCDTYGAQK